MGASSATGRGPRESPSTSLHGQDGRLAVTGPCAGRGPGGGEWRVGPGVARARDRPVPRSPQRLWRTELHSPARREAGRSPHRSSLSVAEARSPRYPGHISSSRVLNSAHRPRWPPIPPFCSPHRTRTTTEIRPGRATSEIRPGGHDAEIRPGGHDRGDSLVATLCARRTARTTGHSSPRDPSRHADGGRLVGYRSAVRQAATVAMTQPAKIVTAYVTHQTQMASMTNSSRYVR